MPAWLNRLRNLFGRDRLTAERSDELRFHFDMEVEAGLRRGLSPEAARRRALQRAGRVPDGLESVRAAFGSRWVDAAGLDLRHAWRALNRSRGFAAGAVLVIASSVALSTLVFAVLDGVVLRPLPYRDPDRLVRLYDSNDSQPKFPVAIAHYLDYREHAGALQGIALYAGRDVEFGENGQPSRRLVGVQVTADFFPVLGVAPMFGRGFTSEDLRASVRHVVLSAGVWRTQFQADPAIVGRAVRLDRTSWTVVGVMPDGFEHVGGDYRTPGQGETVDVWLPLPLDMSEQQMRGWHFTNAVARLNDDVSLEEARADLSRLAAARSRQHSTFDAWDARVEPLHDEVIGINAGAVWLLVAAAVLVLTIAGANVGGLCLARAAARRDELALRRALGAGRWQVARVGLTEALLVGVAGGVLGLAGAAMLLPLILAVVPPDVPRLHEVGLSIRSALVAVSIAMAIAMVAGLLPARGTPAMLGGMMRVTAGRDRLRLRRLLVIGETALAGVLCAGALFLLRSAEEVGARDHGFQSGGVLTFRLTIPEASGAGPEDAARKYEDIRQRLLAAPGVASAGFTSNLPWSGYDENSDFSIPGRPDDDGPSARFQFAGPGFFEAAGMRVIAGRVFDDAHDVAGQPLTIVVNQSLATRYFSGEDAVGATVNLWGADRQIVGVVQGVPDSPAAPEVRPAFWFPLGQMPQPSVFGLVRTATSDPASLTATARAAVQEIDPDMPLADVRTLADRSDAALSGSRFTLGLVQVFAATALMLTATGLHGTLAYVVRQRRRELAVRAALGAGRAALGRLVLVDGVLLVAVGAVGCLIAIPIGGSLLQRYLFNVTPLDPTTIVGVPLALIAMALLASAGPTLVALRTDPVTALREESR